MKRLTGLILVMLLLACGSCTAGSTETEGEEGQLLNEEEEKDSEE